MTGLRVATWLATAPVIIAGLSAAPHPARAQEQRRYSFHLPAGSLAAAIRAVATTSGRSIVAPAELLTGRDAPALDGDYTVEAAVEFLLSGSGLRARAVGDGLVIEAAPHRRAGAASSLAQTDIVVTGSRIRGNPVAAPLIKVDREAARSAGQATLGDIVRSIPQSFGGGQNPGLGFNVPTTSGVDVGGGSSIDLRGLGSDATLTLLNGHRLAYSGSRQAVDVSTIPLDALNRIEIVADGASALYGSDAVGGVANIILRRDLQGVETRARIGGATEGGDFQQQYDVTAGARWHGGGIIAAYEHNDATAIDADQRDYAAVRSRGLRLLPSTRNHDGLLSLQQDIARNLAFTFDGLLNQRRTLFIYPQNAAGDLAVSRAEQSARETAFVIAPALTWKLRNSAHLELAASYGEDKADYRLVKVTPAAATQLTAGCYCNRMLSVELSGDMPLFALPGGPARLAVGIGTRRSGLASLRAAGDPQNFDRTLTSNYGYAELALPLVSPSNDLAELSRLSFDAAVRYERYRAFGPVATPKLGVIWSPVRGVDLKASWGRSFRAPTLQQQYQAVIATLFPATILGGAGLPAGSTALYVVGGNAALKPERASSWSLSAEFRPVSAPGLRLELGYFSTRYTDRIVAPIGFLTQSLSNPLYAAQVTRFPAVAVLQNTIANSIFQLSGVAAYDPAKVVAIVDNSNINAGRQTARGFDGFLSYTSTTGPRDQIALDASATYLVSRRQVSPDQPIIPLAGVLFNPPHWRARGSAGWQHQLFRATAVVNYVGNLSDTRATPPARVPGQATLDIALRYRTADREPALLRGIDLIVAAQNVLDTRPPLIATGPVTDTPYDSTNYSAVGRFVSFTIAKRW